MLKTDWLIKPVISLGSMTHCIFAPKDDEDLTILVKTDTESEAWEKLGALLGKEDKGNVETEIFEGVINVYSCYGVEKADVSFGVASRLTESLVKYKGKRVKVTVEI